MLSLCDCCLAPLLLGFRVARFPCFHGYLCLCHFPALNPPKRRFASAKWFGYMFHCLHVSLYPCAYQGEVVSRRHHFYPDPHTSSGMYLWLPVHRFPWLHATNLFSKHGFACPAASTTFKARLSGSPSTR